MSYQQDAVATEAYLGMPVRKSGGTTGFAVNTSHDAAEPVAFVFDDGHHCAAVCTDTGKFTTLLQQRLQGCELLLRTGRTVRVVHRSAGRVPIRSSDTVSGSPAVRAAFSAVSAAWTDS